jgi:hypothetical protein
MHLFYPLVPLKIVMMVIESLWGRAAEINP